MNRKFVSVFFTALVCSTLGHEYLGTQHLISRHERSFSSGIHNTRMNSEECNFVCPVPKIALEIDQVKDVLTLVFVGEVFGFINSTVDATLTFQVGQPIALLMCGKTGESFVINIEKQTVIHLSGSNENVWQRSKSTYLEYIQKLGSLTSVNNWKNGKTYKLTEVPRQVKTSIISIVRNLSLEIAVRVEINPEAVVQLIAVLIKGLLESKEVLTLGKIPSSKIVITGGVTKLVNLVVGLTSIGKKLNGGIKSLITNNTNVALVLAETNGLNYLLDLMFQVGENVDLTKIFGNLLQNPEAMMGMGEKIDGGIYIGVAGITAVIHNIQLYTDQKITLEALIDILIQVQAANGYLRLTKEHLQEYLQWYFILAEWQSTKFNTGSSWATLTKFVKDLKEEKLIIKGINVSAIIKELVATSGKSSLSNLVKILVHLKPACSLSKLIGTLYFRLIMFISSGQGLLFIDKVLPEIDIKVDFSSQTSIIKQILSKTNYIEVSWYILKLDIIGAITHLPVLGPIFNSLESSIKTLGKAAEVSLSASLKATGSIISDLKNLILFGFGRGGSNAQAESGIHGLSALGGGVTITTVTTTTTSYKPVAVVSSGSQGHGGGNGGWDITWPWG